MGRALVLHRATLHDPNGGDGIRDPHLRYDPGRSAVYLSRLILDPRNRAVHRDLGDCQQMHRTVLGAFPQGDPGRGGPRSQLGVLYRVETDSRRERIEVLVQSRLAPDWSRLPAGYLLDTGG